MLPKGLFGNFNFKLVPMKFQWALSLVLLYQTHAWDSHNTKLCGYKQPAHQTTDTQAYCSKCMSSSL